MINKGVTVFVWNKCDNKMYIIRTNEIGKYVYPVEKSCKLVVLGTCKGFSKDCLLMLAVFDKTSESLIQKAPHDLLLDCYTQNFKWKLSNIHYDFNKWNIRADAYSIIG
jgi:hypothetical protein